MRTTFALLALCATLGCRKHRAFCDRNLSGQWRHADDATYRFRISDQTSAITVAPFREGGGVAGGPTYAIALTPSMNKLAGFAATTATTPGGHICQVNFQWDVVACTDDRITVRSEQEYGVGEDCQRLAGEPDLADSELVRVK